MRVENPSRVILTTLLVLVPVAVMGSTLSVSKLMFDDQLVNVISGFVALLSGALAFCQVCSNEISDRARIGWLVATVALSVLAISQWHEARVQAFERSIGVEDASDLVLLLVIPPAILVGVRDGGRWVKAILIVGICAHVAATAIDMLEGLGGSSPLSRFRTDDLITDLAELAYLELYLVGFWVYAIGELLRDKTRTGIDDERR